MEGKIKDSLREIGLGKVETDVYVDLLRSRTGTATEVAKRMVHKFSENCT